MLKNGLKKIPCIGFGTGAYSYSNDWHYTNLTNNEEYKLALDKNKIPTNQIWSFGTKEKEILDLMWKLKLGKSFDVNEYQKNLLNPYISKELIKYFDGKFKLTDQGRLVSEWITESIIRGN
jgi:coproporphyrinogen III oxidase-like Fe-S oxidoreductase